MSKPEQLTLQKEQDGSVRLIELDPKEIPPYIDTTEIPYKVLQYGITFGLITLGYTCRNYMEYAVETGGYETLLLWGIQGSAKSNRTLAHGYWIYQDWDEVMKHLAFKPSSTEDERGLLQMMKKIPFGKRIPWMGWDDMTVHYPSSSWRTDIQKYEAIDSAWAALRTKVSVMSLNCPLIDRAAKNIKDNVTIEVYIGRNQVEIIERYLHLPGLNKVESNFYKVQVEPLKQFDIYDVPTDVFKEYWQERLKLADEALEKLGNVFTRDEIDLDKYVPAKVAIRDLKVSPITLKHMANDGMIRGMKFNGIFYVLKEDYDNVLVEYYGKRRKRLDVKNSN
jgi:hypothetical protein